MKTVVAAARKSVLVLLVVGLAGCASVDPDADLSSTDNFEGVSRQIHKFNLGFDKNVVRPMAQGYDVVTPTTIKHILGNGFSHLTLPRDFANYLLQGRINPALETLGRFTINTVLGAGGFLDPATEFGLPKQDTDFGITLARHGVGEGSYFVLPLFGPTTTRDSVGRLVDFAFAPTTYVGVIDPGLSPELPVALTALEIIDFRDRYKQPIDEILYESEDSYVSLRAVYLQRRRALAAGDEGAADALPNIFEQ